MTKGKDFERKTLTRVFCSGYKGVSYVFTQVKQQAKQLLPGTGATKFSKVTSSGAC